MMCKPSKPMRFAMFGRVGPGFGAPNPENGLNNHQIRAEKH